MESEIQNFELKISFTRRLNFTKNELTNVNDFLIKYMQR